MSPRNYNKSDLQQIIGLLKDFLLSHRLYSFRLPGGMYRYLIGSTQSHHTIYFTAELTFHQWVFTVLSPWSPFQGRPEIFIYFMLFYCLRPCLKMCSS